ncbi:hypothetical protein CPB85DRAFT_246705 [Mucidula mucida]|nr:hypothetical protein CPB85DRAFT_246705 [Mucidula mucida]
MPFAMIRGIMLYINFNGQVFVVMPRWLNVAIKADFAKVGELVRYGRAFMEAVAFLHEHNVSHGDINLQNMMIDALTPRSKKTTDPLFAGCRQQSRPADGFQEGRKGSCISLAVQSSLY